tara:strand:- start:16613 stop:17605 length:993 start_codon:yes stop_codon:yes gene_type:complete
MKIKIAIIGAGLSGISAALELSNMAEVTIFEKSRGYGGRMSTRTRGDYQFDHGAQYFFAKHKPFKALAETLISKSILQAWEPKLVHFDGNKPFTRLSPSPQHKFYVPTPKMTSLCRFLASDLNVQLNTKVDKIIESDKWSLYEKGTLLGKFDWVIFAIPPRQVIEISPPCFDYLDEISKIKMDGCYALMVGNKTVLDLSWDAAHISGHDLSWIALNNSKQQRPKLSSIVAHSTHAWAEENMENNNQSVIDHLINELSTLIGVDMSGADHIDLHRWRFANATEKNTESTYVDIENRLAACGDWCLESNVEGAFNSGQVLASTVKHAISDLY